MTKENQHQDDGWDRGWEQHKKRQLRRIARLPMDAKLEWLEEAQKLGEKILSQTKRTSTRDTSGP
jgi:hypothetical protein